MQVVISPQGQVYTLNGNNELKIAGTHMRNKRDAWGVPLAVPGKENESELVSPLVGTQGIDEKVDRRSRMKREFHVRFCERPKGRFLWPTRPLPSGYAERWP